MCECLRQSLPQDSIIAKDISFAVLNEISEYSIMGDRELRLKNGVSNFLSKIKPSQISDYDGKKAITLNCLKYYNSSTLDSLVKQLKY